MRRIMAHRMPDTVHSFSAGAYAHERVPTHYAGLQESTVLRSCELDSPLSSCNGGFLTSAQERRLRPYSCCAMHEKES